MHPTTKNIDRTECVKVLISIFYVGKINVLNFTDKVLELMFRTDCVAQTKPCKCKIRTFSVVFVRGPSIHTVQLQLKS